LNLNPFSSSKTVGGLWFFKLFFFARFGWWNEDYNAQ
jgi:hypothetical protein